MEKMERCGQSWLKQLMDHIIKTEKHIPANEEVMRDEFIADARREFTNNEFNTMISNATVEKTELYDTISIIRESDRAEEMPETNTTTSE